jgi:hypothetical protein
VQWLDIRRHNFFQSPFCFLPELGESGELVRHYRCVNKTLNNDKLIARENTRNFLVVEL